MASQLTVDNIVGQQHQIQSIFPIHIIQIQSILHRKISLSTNSTFHTVGHSLNFTPKFSTSKVFVMFQRLLYTAIVW